MKRLFDRLIAFYGVKFADAYANVGMDDMRQVWGEELYGYTLDELNRGVTACKALKWPPTLPEFLTLCRPPLNYEVAYHEAIEKMRLREQGVNSDWSHKAVFHTAIEITAFELRRLPWERIKARWCATLDRKLATPGLPDVPPAPLMLPDAAVRGPNEKEREALRSVTELFKPKDHDADASDVV